MIVSLGGFIIAFNHLDNLGITGRAATDTGTTNFTINSSISVVFIQDKVDFGSGIVNTTQEPRNCTLNTTGPGMLNGGTNNLPNIDCIGFNNTLRPLVIQNQGTINVTLNMTFSQVASTFIGGTSPSFAYRTSWNETKDSCGLNSLNGNVSVTEVPAANQNVSICNATRFNWVSGKRTLNVDLGIKIPFDVAPGTRLVTITAFASNP